ncbi:MAG: tetratricopeptide repeat protein [Lentisphaerae bacterium]|nr:tetratricopeptide repeat protein [Lentisphaerota bacterium]
MRPVSTRLCVLALLALAVLPYLNSLGNGYTIDDFFTYADNAFIRSRNNLPHLFNANYFGYSNEASYRPVCTASYFIDWALWGARAMGPHLSNVLLYAATVIALFFLYRALTASALAAGLGAALFALHPVHTEVVNNLSFREDLQVGLLLPLSWLAYRRGRHAAPGLWFPVAWLLYALATLAKEMAVIYPALALLLDWTIARHDAAVPSPATPAPPAPWRSLLQRPGMIHVLGLGVVTMFFLLLRFHWMQCPMEGHEPRLGGSLLGTLLADVKIQAYYLFLFVFPLRLSAYYPISSYTPELDPGFFISLSALLVVAASLIHGRRSVFFITGMLWWFVSLAPVANIYPIFNPMAERYLYLPSIGLCLWLGWELARGLHSRYRRVLVVASLLVAAAMTARVCQRNPVWRDNVTLWTATARHVPDHPTVLANLAAAYYERGDYDRVIACATRALVVARADAAGFEPASSYLPLGCALYVRGDKDEALRYFQAAEKRLPLRFDLDAAIYRNLALSYDDRGDFQTSAGYYEKALTIDPFRPQDWAKRAYACLLSGQPDAGRAAWERARRLNPKLPAFAVFEAAVAQDADSSAPHAPGSRP